RMVVAARNLSGGVLQHGNDGRDSKGSAALFAAGTTAPVPRGHSNNINIAERACLADWLFGLGRLIPELIPPLADRAGDGVWRRTDSQEQGFRQPQRRFDGFGHDIGGAQLIEASG